MTETVPTRQRLIDAASVLFRRQGLTATGIKQILAEADAPFSSLYHHFPGGKDELAAKAIADAGQHYEALVGAVWDSGTDLETSVAMVFDGAAELLVATDYADACPIATVALEVASTNEPLRAATAEVFESWIAGATELFAAAGIARGTSRELALTMLSLLEGAFLFSRALRATEPMEIAGASAVAAVRAALAASSSGTDER